MTGKSLRLVFAALVLVTAVSCSKDGLSSDGSKASIKVKSIDLTGAQSPMVMPVPEDVATKAGDDGQPQVLVDKLFTVDENGEVSVAVFTFECDGMKKDRNWEEAECRLQLVPGQMEVLDNGYILLNMVSFSPPSVYSQQKEKVKQALDEVTNALSYLLRPSDGALFPLNLIISALGNRSPMSSSTSENGKTVVLSSLSGEMFPVYSENGWPIYFATVTDKGNEIELRYTDAPTFYEALFPYGIKGNGDFLRVGFLKSDKIVFYRSTCDNCTGNGMWLLDSELNPHFYDFSPNAASLISAVNPDPFYFGDEDFVVNVFVYEKDLYRLILSDGVLYLYRFVFSNDVTDLEQVCSLQVDSDFYAWTFKYNFNGNEVIGFKNTSDGFEIIDAGNTTIKYDRGRNQLSYTTGFPEGFPESRLDYNSKGISYAISENLDMIDRYDLNSLKHNSYSVNWGPEGKAPFVSSNCYVDKINGMCTVSGFTREATKMTFVIDLETGNVTNTEITEYSGSVVQSFARLN